MPVSLRLVREPPATAAGRSHPIPIRRFSESRDGRSRHSSDARVAKRASAWRASPHEKGQEGTSRSRPAGEIEHQSTLIHVIGQRAAWPEAAARNAAGGSSNQLFQRDGRFAVGSQRRLAVNLNEGGEKNGRPPCPPFSPAVVNL